MSSPTDARIDAILEVLLAFARHDFRQRAPVSPRRDALDAVATGLNMLAEELDGAVASRQELEEAYRSLQEAQGRLVHSGKLVALGQLASCVAHEINNPTQWVQLSLALLSRQLAEAQAALAEPGLSPEALRARLGRVLQAAEAPLADAREGMERIRTVTDGLRTFSRTDGDTREVLALGEVVRSACSLARPLLQGSARVELALDEALRVSGNRGRLGQVVTNLLVNAAQAVGEGDPAAHRIRVESQRAGSVALLAVEDTGPGVPRELRARIFEPFFTTKPAEQGTGLGLSLVADLVGQLGGTVQVTDASLGGARFEVRLPAVDAAP